MVRASTIEQARATVLFYDKHFHHDFYKWLNANFPIFSHFEISAIQTYQAGFKHYSARTIVEVMRHRSNIREIGDGNWKLNNNRTPDMAKLYLLLHPEHSDFFELRHKAA